MPIYSSSARMNHHPVIPEIATLQFSQFTDGHCFFSMLHCAIQVLQSYCLRWSLQSSDFNQGLECVMSTNRHHHVAWLGPPVHREWNGEWEVVQS